MGDRNHPSPLPRDAAEREGKVTKKTNHEHDHF